MTTLLLDDMAYALPPAQQPAVDGVCIYGPGGNPLHVWTPVEIGEQTSRYRLPIMVQSNPIGASYISDANAFVAWLKQIGCPRGAATVLDIEMAVAPAYVSAYGHVMNSSGYKVLPYGAVSTLFNNPKLDGFFVADWTGTPGILTGCVAQQYESTATYDLDDIAASVPLWDTRPEAPKPAPKPLPVTLPKKKDIGMFVVKANGTEVGSVKPGTYWMVYPVANSLQKYIIETPSDQISFSSSLPYAPATCGWLNNIPNMP